ncbi:unnamed protein product [Meloidogyne enterolobii]|uniref:Uncharacterized protein n=1 Tax=Meloidogyne enterolobii TaxID=390850 RepID=A0ACB0YU08_MELEN
MPSFAFFCLSLLVLSHPLGYLLFSFWSIYCIFLYLDSVFAGTMALMANLKLSTLRPIVNHPHYENEEIRRRTLRVYSLYSRKSVEEVYFDLKKMGVQFYVFQPQQCLQKHPKKECSYLAMWDLQDPKNRLWNGIINSNQSLLGSFLPVYISESYVVLKIEK